MEPIQMAKTINCIGQMATGHSIDGNPLAVLIGMHTMLPIFDSPLFARHFASSRFLDRFRQEARSSEFRRPYSAIAIVFAAVGPRDSTGFGADDAVKAWRRALTDREREIAGLAAQGLGNQQIAKRPGLADGTIRF
jgi:hypothetical protein